MNILDKVNEVIENCMAQIQLLDVLIKSRFVEMFGEPGINPLGWKTTTLGNECYYIKDGPHKSLSDIGKGNGGYPFISVRNIVNGYIDFTTAKYISDEDYQSAIKKCHPEKGDMLYSKGGTTGIAKLVDVDVKFANWVHLAVLKFDKSVLNGVFLENMLNCDYCYTQSQKLTKGIANRDLVLSAMAQIKIYKPPIELQYIGQTFAVQEYQDVVIIASDFPDEYTGSRYTKKLRGALAKVKANAAQIIDRMIQNATNRRWNENREDKHRRNASEGWYRYDTYFNMTVKGSEEKQERLNEYRATLIVRKTAEGLFLYDVIDIKKEARKPLEFKRTVR